MKLLQTLSGRFFRRSAPPEAPGMDPLERAQEILLAADLPPAEVWHWQRFSVSPDKRYCALMLAPHHICVVDLQTCCFVHLPGAGLQGFAAPHELFVGPDEGAGAKHCQAVDLASAELDWRQGCAAAWRDR